MAELTFAVGTPSRMSMGAIYDEKDIALMVDILNLALPYFGLIFIGFACGKTKKLPEQGLAWMNFFLLYVSLPALLFGIMSKTPFEELNNPPLADCDYPRNEHCFRPCPVRRQAGGAARSAKQRWPASSEVTVISAGSRA